MDGDFITVDVVTDAGGGPLLRFTCTPVSAATLRHTFEQLSEGKADVATPRWELRGIASLELRRGPRGGARRTSAGVVIEGDLEDWSARAELLEPLASDPPGFQFLDDLSSQVGIVVTTYPDGTF